ncbi:helix-turn-helix domain-containing protein, partial [Streptomyces sp. CHB9.2]
MVDYNIIKEERIKKNLTVTDLANLCSVSASYITKIEKGNVKITDSMQNKLAEVLNLKKGLRFEFKA